MNETSDCAAKSALDLLHVTIDGPFFPGQGCGCVTSFIPSSLSWEIGNHLTGGAGRMKVACIGHTHLTHSCILINDHPIQCEDCQCIATVLHILVACNHLAQTWKDIFGRRDVLESFRFHPTFVLLCSRKCQFLLYILIDIIVIILFFTALYFVFFNLMMLFYYIILFYLFIQIPLTHNSRCTFVLGCR